MSDQPERRELLELMQEHQSQLTGVLDPEGRVLAVNSAAREFSGMEESEVIGNFLWSFPHWIDAGLCRRVFESAVKELETNDQYSFDLDLKDRTAAIHSIELNFDAIRGKHGELRYIIAEGREITLRKQAELDLAASEQKFRNLIETSPMGIHMYDLNEHGELIFTGANPAADKILGLDNRQFIGKTIADAFPNLSDTDVPAHYARIAGSGGFWTDQQVLYEDDKISGAFEVHAFQTSKDSMAAMFLDITDRKRAEVALQESEAHYRTIFGSSPDAIMLLQDNTFVDCNQQTLEIFGCSRPRFIGRSPVDFSPEFQSDGTPSEIAAWDRISQAETGRTVTFEWIHTRESGEEFEAEVRLKRVNIAGQPRMLAFVRDISDRKNLERERELLTSQIEDSRNRLKVLSTDLLESQEFERRKIARELHDDIGQLLTAMKINVQQLHDTSAEDLFEACKRRSIEQLELIDTMISQVRNLALDLRPSILDDLGLVPALRWYVDKQSELAGISGTVDAEQEDYPLTDSLRVGCYRVAQEAVSNILKHAQAASFRIKLAYDGNVFEMIITDDGRGFEVEAARRQSLQGESFGLVSMQERIELLGGTLTINSHPGNGTVIAVRFTLNHK